jgi:hypothetical protein
MQEHIHNWLTEKMKIPGVLACGLRSPDRKIFTRSLSPQFQPVALEAAFRSVGDTFQIMNTNRFPTGFVRWVFENYFLYAFSRPDGHCFGVLSRRDSKHPLDPLTLGQLSAEFLSLEG